MRRSPRPLVPILTLLLVLGGALLHAVPASAEDRSTQRPLRAAFLVVDGVYNSELMAPYDVLQHTIFHTKPGIEVFTVSPDGAPVTTFEGLRLTPDHSFDTAPPIDILIVPSAEGSLNKDLEDERMIGWVRETGRKARFVMSLCDGAFVLAQAGLLDGRTATTFPTDYQAFADRFRRVDLKINVSFVHDGPMLTSEGGARSYDVAMYLVDLLYGTEVAAGVGGGLLIPWPPEPGAVATFVADPASLPDDGLEEPGDSTPERDTAPASRPGAGGDDRGQPVVSLVWISVPFPPRGWEGD